jgi:hypothetical protein
MAFQDMHRLLDAIVDQLFAADNRRLQAWVDKLCQKNQEVRRTPVVGFLYGGVYYRPSNVLGLVHDKRALDPSLYDDVDTFLKDKSTIDADKHSVRQALFSILDPCKDLQDIRDTLPEFLVDCAAQYAPHLRSLTRSEETAFTIRDNPRALRQFNKALPKLETYAAARLIY